MDIRRRLAPIAFPTTETSVPTIITTEIEGPYVEFFLIDTGIFTSYFGRRQGGSTLLHWFAFHFKTTT